MTLSQMALSQVTIYRSCGTFSRETRRQTILVVGSIIAYVKIDDEFFHCLLWAL